jgi:glycine/D-amino acid oxidase-like deaminating enzyme
MSPLFSIKPEAVAILDAADKHAILGPAPGVPNLYLINGSSGHGVMHAPALGHLLAEIVCDGSASTLDVHALRPGRFVEQDLNPVSELL